MFDGKLRVAILTTGGTIEKQFDERSGSLRNVGSVLQEILGRLRLPSCDWRHIPVMSKDSLDMTPEDRQTILAAVQFSLRDSDAALVIHGTDTLSATGELLHERLTDLKQPVVMTGAMRPFEFRDTDAFQNMTEGLLACRVAPPGVYVAMHNQLLKFPGVVKDRLRSTFVYQSALTA